MKCIVRIMSVFLLVGCCVYAFGKEKAEEAEVIRKMGQEVQGLQLSVEIGKEAYRTGEKIEITISLKNVGGKEAWLTQTTPFCTFDVDLRFADGPPTGTFAKKEDDQVPLTLFGQVDRNFANYNRSQLKLTPQHEYRATLDLSRFFDLSLSGRYEVTVQKRLPANSSDKPRAVRVPTFLFSVKEE